MGRRIGAVAVVAGLAGGGAVGALLAVPVVSGAQEATTSTTAAPGESGERRRAGAEGGPLATALANLVERGTITRAQADAVKAEVRSVAPERGAGGPGRGRGHREVALSAAATVLGVEETALKAELRAGKTLATIAGERNVALDAVAKALVDEATKRIDAAVADGRLTEAQATKAKAGLEERVTRFVNEGFAAGGPGGPGRGGPGRGGRHGGAAAADSGEAAA